MGLIERIVSGEILVADGASGTLLQERGMPPGSCPELLNLNNAELIESIARDYANAGSDLVYTNTFGGNRIRLSNYNAGDRVREINIAAVRIARKAVQGKAYVIGSIGPTGKLLKPFGDLSEEETYEAFLEQAKALYEGGVDGIVLESFSDLKEVLLAIKAAKNFGLPLFCSMTFEMYGKTMMGVSPEQAAPALLEDGVKVIGANCGRGLEETEETLKRMAAAIPGVPLLAKPNAGLPSMVRGKVVYNLEPDQIKEFARKVIPLGVRIIGGCCGTKPEHIRAMAETVKKDPDEQRHLE